LVARLEVSEPRLKSPGGDPWNETSRRAALAAELLEQAEIELRDGARTAVSVELWQEQLSAWVHAL
jgi:hypothetical protein